MPGTPVIGGRDMGGMPGKEMLEMGGKLGSPGIGAIPGKPTTKKMFIF